MLVQRSFRVIPRKYESAIKQCGRRADVRSSDCGLAAFGVRSSAVVDRNQNHRPVVVRSAFSETPPPGQQATGTGRRTARPSVAD